MNVSRTSLAVGHKGVKTSLTADAAALHTPEGGDWSTHDSQGGGDELGRAHRVDFSRRRRVTNSKEGLRLKRSLDRESQYRAEFKM